MPLTNPALDFSSIPNNQHVLLRVDYNIAHKNSTWQINERVLETLQPIHALLRKNCSVLLVSHKGRPAPGPVHGKDSLRTLAPALSQLLDKTVTFLPNWPSEPHRPSLGNLYLAENTRFLVGETANSSALSTQMVHGVDYVAMDAFACSHRSHASTTGILCQGKPIVLGVHHAKEIKTIEKLCTNRERKMALIGGKKISTKLSLLAHLSERCNDICIGGGLANTLWYAQGYHMGSSWVEYEQLEEAKRFLRTCQKHATNLHLPKEVMVVEGVPEAHSIARAKPIEALDPNDTVIDLGPQSIATFQSVMLQHQQIYWNGPMGLYEFDYGLHATEALAQTISDHAQMSCIGGGDTLSAIGHLPDLSFTHKSTGGGAFLHFLANKTSPVLEIFRRAEQQLALHSSKNSEEHPV